MKASDIARALGGKLEGEDVEISACAGLEEARAGDLSFCKDPKHVRLVETTAASAVLLPEDCWRCRRLCAALESIRRRSWILPSGSGATFTSGLSP